MNSLGLRTGAILTLRSMRQLAGEQSVGHHIKQPGDVLAPPPTLRDANNKWAAVAKKRPLTVPAAAPLTHSLNHHCRWHVAMARSILMAGRGIRNCP